MKTIEVKSCEECPFIFISEYEMEYCRLDSDIREVFMPENAVHENCPLKTESVTVKLKDDPNNN